MRQKMTAAGSARETPKQSDRGAVTAEFAVALPAIVLVLVGGLTGISAGITQLRLEEAARAAAREVMRADQPAAAAAVQRLAGDSAELILSVEGRWTAVEVRSSLTLPVLSLLPLELSADAVAFPGDGGLPHGIPSTG
ncbi:MULTISPECIES: TadE family type IV pilus minor pilin [unclassified Arthrobacter]|uniref:TadE family type IV pilus minor pilin n=1 Tax=unclassified Arthrobacter TaxID=235627 RepID=UPI001D15AF98|nr:TadE family type IV pilus minor pilin [Arthrobacter sp. zg-Y1110]MCC3290069.1 pilus assembly protein [Arthrobacter sp. zg-Y1110]MCC3300419.1 pilus assembly protein [Arthrobacter sp. zg-Y895]UWX84536.1 pilus assembly protein [Arthrobacter sp. zg-Y1110]